jgi:hypothetical protein
MAGTVNDSTNVKRRLELRGTAARGDASTTISPTIRRRSRRRVKPACERQESAAAASWRFIEPRSNTMKLGVMKAQLLPASLAEADQGLLLRGESRLGAPLPPSHHWPTEPSSKTISGAWWRESPAPHAPAIRCW